MASYRLYPPLFTVAILRVCNGNQKALDISSRQWKTTYYCGKRYNDVYRCEINCVSETASECPPEELCFSGVFCPASKPSITPVPDNYCGIDGNQAKDCHEPCPYGRGCSKPDEHCWAGITQCLNKSPSPTPSNPSIPTKFCGKNERA